MLQAEIGSARVTAGESLPSRGHLMPDFTLPSTDAKQVSLYDYRGRSNLVVFFASPSQDSAEKQLLSALAERYREITDADSEVVVVVAESIEQADEFRRERQFPFPVLADADMHVHNSVGTFGAQGVPTAALYITDRFWRCSQRGAVAPARVCLTFRMSFPGSLIWTVSVLNAHRSSGHLTIEPRQNMIKLKRVYESMENDDGKKFLVERLWPRGMKKTALANAVWLKDVAPSTELRKWFGHDPKRWEEFQRRYRVELKEHQAVLQSILQAARRGTVTLVYSSHDTEHNNAVVLRNYLQRKLGSDRPLKRGKLVA